MSLVLLPAVDVQEGQAVQLTQGVAGTQKEFGDPLAAAKRWESGGAQWLHLVDLDAAFGRGNNAEIIAKITDEMQLNVELSGGIRNDETLKRALATGCARVNIGTAALEDPDWCIKAIETYGDRIAISLDVRDRKLAARGWVREGGDVYETLKLLSQAGCARFVVTDVLSDGMLTGPNIELLRTICANTEAAVVASGGISSLDDLRKIKELGTVEGAIVGTALYLGNFTLADALKVCAE